MMHDNGELIFTTKCDVIWENLWHVAKGETGKIKEINIIIEMFFFIFYSLLTSVTFDTNIRGDPSKNFWKENNSNCHIIPIIQNINFAPFDGFSQIKNKELE